MSKQIYTPNSENSYVFETRCQLTPLSTEEEASFKKAVEENTRKPEIDPRAEMRKQIYEMSSPFTPEDARDVEDSEFEQIILTQEEKDLWGPDVCKHLEK